MRIRRVCGDGVGVGMVLRRRVVELSVARKVVMTRAFCVDGMGGFEVDMVSAGCELLVAELLGGGSTRRWD